MQDDDIKENNSETENIPDVNAPKKPQKRHNPFRAFIIILIAILLLAGLSYLPLSELTGGRVKEFNLLSDLFGTADTDSITKKQSQEGVDPELLKAMNDGGTTTIATDSSHLAAQDSVIIPEKPSRVGDLIQIEDYTLSQQGISRLRQTLASGRLGRIAVVGDSYIEGDIFTQDLRDQLQNIYGGSGVGYMNMHTEFPGFRRSIKQGGKGWNEFALGKKGKKEYFGISQHYFSPTGKATSTYSGSDKLLHTSQWTHSRFLFISPVATTVKTKTSGGEWNSHQIEGSPEVQCIEIHKPTSDFEIEVSSPSLIGLGVWLDNDKGISLDCMSSRGFSGITLAKVDEQLTKSISRHIDYDLIILEFGINAMSAGQLDYSIYGRKMENVISHVRRLYPSADILVMGVGDRGEKKGGVVNSMEAGTAMIAEQRSVARRAHTLFWDTREAMGGIGAIARWASSGMANKDYVHLTHKGGKELATQLTKAIQKSINR